MLSSLDFQRSSMAKGYLPCWSNAPEYENQNHHESQDKLLHDSSSSLLESDGSSLQHHTDNDKLGFPKTHQDEYLTKRVTLEYLSLDHSNSIGDPFSLGFSTSLSPGFLPSTSNIEQLPQEVHPIHSPHTQSKRTGSIHLKSDSPTSHFIEEDFQPLMTNVISSCYSSVSSPSVFPFSFPVDQALHRYLSMIIPSNPPAPPTRSTTTTKTDHQDIKEHHLKNPEALALSSYVSSQEQKKIFQKNVIMSSTPFETVLPNEQILHSSYDSSTFSMDASPSCPLDASSTTVEQCLKQLQSNDLFFPDITSYFDHPRLKKSFSSSFLSNASMKCCNPTQKITPTENILTELLETRKDSWSISSSSPYHSSQTQPSLHIHHPSKELPKRLDPFTPCLFPSPTNHDLQNNALSLKYLNHHQNDLLLPPQHSLIHRDTKESSSSTASSISSISTHGSNTQDHRDQTLLQGDTRLIKSSQSQLMSQQFLATSQEPSPPKPPRYIQELLHTQCLCKPCAFFYNKKKGCSNGDLCEFCHHEDHSRYALKQWKKHQQRFIRQFRRVSMALTPYYPTNQSTFS